MIIPGILASRAKDAGVGYLLRSVSVLTVSKESRLLTPADVTAASLLTIRRAPYVETMADGVATAASLLTLREAPRHVGKMYLREAAAMAVHKSPRTPPSIMVRTATALAAHKRPRTAPNVSVRMGAVLNVYKKEAA